MRRYIGRRGSELTVVVSTEGSAGARPLPPRIDLVNHSPTGFECGYEGSGPAQLAVAMLADHFRHRPEDARLFAGDIEAATPADMPMRLHQDFKRHTIARLPRDSGWALTTGEITYALGEIARARKVTSKESRSTP